MLFSILSRNFQFGGYVMPHPMERLIHVRIQTVGGETSFNVLKRSLLKLKEQNVAVKEMIQVKTSAVILNIVFISCGVIVNIFSC